MNEIKIVNLNEKYDIDISKNDTVWGIPTHLRKYEQEKLLSKYKTYIMSSPTLSGMLTELEGKILGCNCTDKKYCHGNTLKFLVKEVRKYRCSCNWVPDDFDSEDEELYYGKNWNEMEEKIEKIVERHKLL